MILMFVVFMEIVTTSIAIMNVIAVTFGSNLINPWFIDPVGPWTTEDSHTPFDVVTSLICIIGVLYTIVIWIIFLHKVDKMK